MHFLLSVNGEARTADSRLVQLVVLLTGHGTEREQLDIWQPKRVRRESWLRPRTLQLREVMLLFPHFTFNFVRRFIQVHVVYTDQVAASEVSAWALRFKASPQGFLTWQRLLAQRNRCGGCFPLLTRCWHVYLYKLGCSCGGDSLITGTWGALSIDSLRMESLKLRLNMGILQLSGYALNLYRVTVLDG